MKIERRKDEKQFFCFTWPAVLSQQHLELSIQRGYSMTTVGNYPKHFWAFFTGRHDIHSCNKMRVKSTILLTFEQGCGTPRRQHGNCLHAPGNNLKVPRCPISLLRVRFGLKCNQWPASEFISYRLHFDSSRLYRGTVVEIKWFRASSCSNLQMSKP